MRLFDLMPRKDEKGNLIYNVYWAIGKFNLSDYERPWMEFLVDPITLHCYPITTIKPTKNLENYFFISRERQGFEITSLKYDSWVNISTKETFPAKQEFRKQGWIKGEISADFTKWLKAKKAAGYKAPNPSNPPLRERLEDADVFIAPWMYKILGADPVSQFELAAVGAYEDAIKKKSTPEGVCFYDGVKNRIIRAVNDIPATHWWFRAYADYIWVNYLDDEVKDKWMRTVMKSRNVEAATYLMNLYVLHVRMLDSNEELTLEAAHRIMLSEAVVRTFLDPPEAKKKEFFDFATENFWPFFFIRAQP